jgi:hypothetical protein
MKKIITLLFLVTCICSYAVPTSSGVTGTIDFPSAYLLRERNYTFTGNIENNSSKEEDSLSADFIFETGFIPQVEAGFNISTKNEELNQSFVQSNLKYQIVKEEKNPAIAIGYVEFDEYQVMADHKNENIDAASNAYVYLVLSKRLEIDTLKLDSSLGMKYSKSNDGENVVDFFSGVEIPLYSQIRVLGEVYSYRRNDVDNKRLSMNLGAEFLTKENIRTKIFWRERNSSFGFGVTYIGILDK